MLSRLAALEFAVSAETPVLYFGSKPHGRHVEEFIQGA
jgi:hypothetical protein